MADETWDQFHEEFQAALLLVEDRALPIASEMIYKVLAHIQELLSVIPEQPDRARAKTFNTYVRNIGNFPKAAFSQDAQGIWKRRRQGAYDVGKVRYTSQQSSKRWGIYINDEENAVTGALRNDASYSGWLWGPLDMSADPHQVAWHTETGWISQDTALEEAQEVTDDLLAGAVNEIMAILSERGGVAI
jgi:hypothetical protein